jgi:hypothetical protein
MSYEQKRGDGVRPLPDRRPRRRLDAAAAPGAGQQEAEAGERRELQPETTPDS